MDQPSGHGAIRADVTNPLPTAPWEPATNHFFCVPKSTAASSGLANMLAEAASSLASGAHLIQLPVPPPIITSISPASWSKAGGTTITLTGKYFTDVYSVSFGGGSATIFPAGRTPP